MRFPLQKMILTAIYAALTAVFSQISFHIPLSPVPITLQILAVFLSAILLGSKFGALSQIIYLLLGIIGVPVFANFNAGAQVLIGPTGGFLISFPIIAFVIGYLIEKKNNASRIYMVFVMIIGMMICYAIGATWLGFSFHWTIKKTLMVGVLPYIPLDIVKIIMAAILGYQVRDSLVKANLIRS